MLKCIQNNYCESNNLIITLIFSSKRLSNMHLPMFISFQPFIIVLVTFLNPVVIPVHPGVPLPIIVLLTNKCWSFCFMYVKPYLIKWKYICVCYVAANAVLVRVSLTVARHNDHVYSDKGKHSIGVAYIFRYLVHYHPGRTWQHVG